MTPEHADNLFGREDDAFVELALAYLDGVATRSEVERLDVQLHDSERRREQFVTLALQARAVAETVRPPAQAQLRGHAMDPVDDTSDVLREVLEIERETAKRRAQQQRHATAHLTQAADWHERMRLVHDETASPTQVRHIVIPRALFYGMIGAMTAAVVAIAVMVYDHYAPPQLPQQDTLAHDALAPEPEQPTPPAPVMETVAQLVAAVDAQWEAASPVPQQGERVLSHQPLSLTRGLVKLRFDTGAEVIVRAPARFTALSAGELRLLDGELVGRCMSDAARGFVVQTADARIVDIGTEFGVRADASATEAHVFSGKVMLTTAKATSALPLQAGAAARVSAGSTRIVQTMAATSTFVREDEFNAGVLAEQGSAYHRWVAYSYQLRREPEVLAYYTFDGSDIRGDMARNVAASTQGRLDASLRGTQPDTQPVVVPGRFEQSLALDFTPAGQDFVWAQVEHDAALESLRELTIAAWVRRSPKDGGTIVSKRKTDSHLTFQMAIFGDARFQPYTNALQFGTGNADSVSAVFFHSSPAPDGTEGWRFAVTTFHEGEVCFYLDGALVSREKVGTPLGQCDAPMLIGAAPSSLVTTGPDPFLGSIDELIIFRRALTGDEVQSLYRATAP